jgi:hypothetical protein
LDSESADVMLLGSTMPFSQVVTDSINYNYFSVVDLCCLLGKHTHLAILFIDVTNKIAAIRENNYRLITLAVDSGHRATIEYLETHLTSDDRHQVIIVYTSAIWKVARNGHTDAIQYLERYLTSDQRNKAVREYKYWMT